MRNDTIKFKPFKDNFIFEVLEKNNNLQIAHLLERVYIAKYKSTTAKGYNTLQGHPPHCKKYNFLRQTKKI